MNRLDGVRGLVWLVLVAAAVPLLWAQGPDQSATPAVGARSCVGDTSLVAWDWVTDAKDRKILDRWCDTVGPPLLVRSEGPSADVKRLVIMSWNVHVGSARLPEMIQLVRARSRRPDGGAVGFVLLLQEAFRGGQEVPSSLANDAKVPKAIVPDRPSWDVEQLARETGMSLLYVPSMRNGTATNIFEREDRGNAILSSEPITDVSAIELPFGVQRRVAVLASISPRGSTIPPLTVVAAHLDTRGPRVQQAKHLIARLSDPAKKIVHPLLIGADMNAPAGLLDSAVRAVDDFLPREKLCGAGRTTKWLARIDFMFSDLPASVTRSCETLENPDFYGSDHTPAILTIN